MVGLPGVVPGVKALGKKNAANLTLTTAFYRDRTPESREFSKRFYDKVGAMPDMYLARLKKPENSTGEWDMYNIVRTIDGTDAFQPISQGSCSLAQAQ